MSHIYQQKPLKVIKHLTKTKHTQRLTEPEKKRLHQDECLKKLHPAPSSRHTDRGLVSVEGNIVHLIDMVVQEALLRMGLDDLAQGLPAQLFGRQSWRLTVYTLWRPERWEMNTDNFVYYCKQDMLQLW